MSDTHGPRQRRLVGDPTRSSKKPDSEDRQRATAARRRVEGELRTPEKILGERMAELRTRQGLTAEQLTERIKDLGGPSYDRATISRIEAGRRGVSLDEALILAAALKVAPVNVFIPTEDAKYAPVQLTSAIEAPSSHFREWVRGTTPLAQLEDKWYWIEIPSSEAKRFSKRVSAYKLKFEESKRLARIAEVKADLISERIAKLGSEMLIATSPEKMRERDQLNARLDVALDRVAEARVDLEDAREQLAQAEQAAKRRAVNDASYTTAVEQLGLLAGQQEQEESIRNQLLREGYEEDSPMIKEIDQRIGARASGMSRLEAYLAVMKRGGRPEPPRR